MKYTQLRLDCELAKKGRLYRVILAKSDSKLDELGAYLVFIFEGTMEHYFLYHRILANTITKVSRIKILIRPF